jgi:hypothetical protein
MVLDPLLSIRVFPEHEVPKLHSLPLSEQNPAHVVVDHHVEAEFGHPSGSSIWSEV